MRRPYTLTLSAIILPGTVGGLGDNIRKMHFAGLGDGNVDNQQGLRGAGRKRKRTGGKGGDQDDLQSRFDQQSPFLHRGDDQSPGTDTVDDDVEFYRKGANHRATLVRHREDISLQEEEGATTQTFLSDGPWQLSILMLFGIMCVLVGLFIHFSTDPNGRRRMKMKPRFRSPRNKKKTDDWCEDEEMTEDDNYRGDTEGAAGVESTIAKKRSSKVPIAPDDPAASLYYGLKTSGNNFRQQEHRLRKSTQQTTNNISSGAGGVRNRPTESPVPTFHTPSRPSTSSTHSGNSCRKFGKASSSPFPPPPLPHLDSRNIGSGLEGFGHSAPSFEADMGISNINAPAIKNLVRPMGTFTPSESFGSIPSLTTDQKSTGISSIGVVHTREDVDVYTPPISVKERAQSTDSTPLPTSSPSWQSGNHSEQYNEQLSELPTPRVDHRRGKRDLSRVYMEQGRNISDIPLSCANQKNAVRETPDPKEDIFLPQIQMDNKISATSGSYLGLPLVPNLNDGLVGSSGFQIDAPCSVRLDDLQLVRMESGVPGPKWRAKDDLQQNAERNEMQRQETENMEKLREASAAVDPADDPRNSIQHIRKDLTISSDASSSLSSKIAFSELKLEDVIGGGGFGQVWRAKWKGTPVAVKVLTGSAQAETVPKAVLEEFIAEINMLSGMRHPNICLFVGGCLEPPNRAIITELCENGSLWDALRSPLSIYQIADGMTRLAWPLDLYEPMISSPPTFSNIDPPLAPDGAWPWVLVKRVAAGTARGMCYLHSGNPPVLHRDLKSANILLDESYTAKLADFGLSRLKAVRSGMTGNCGTVQWMAPEVLCNENYAEPADVFSFGIILWETLTKECPYDGMTPIQCALSVLNKNKRPKIPNWCPQSLRALIVNCLEKDPVSRPTFTQILAALDAMP